MVFGAFIRPETASRFAAAQRLIFANKGVCYVGDHVELLSRITSRFRVWRETLPRRFRVSYGRNALSCGPSLSVALTVTIEHPAGNLKRKSSATSRILVLM
jgi:hypothetical protein